MSRERRIEFYIKLKKLMDQYKDTINENNNSYRYDDDKWMEMRVPYFFMGLPEKWDGDGYGATNDQLLRINIGDHIDYFKDMLKSGYTIHDSSGGELSIDDLFADFDIFMDQIYQTIKEYQATNE